MAKVTLFVGALRQTLRIQDAWQKANVRIRQ